MFRLTIPGQCQRSLWKRAPIRLPGYDQRLQLEWISRPPVPGWCHPGGSAHPDRVCPGCRISPNWPRSAWSSTGMTTQQAAGLHANGGCDFYFGDPVAQECRHVSAGDGRWGNGTLIQRPAMMRPSMYWFGFKNGIIYRNQQPGHQFATGHPEWPTACNNGTVCRLRQPLKRMN